MSERVRTDVENLFLSEMVTEDRFFMNKEESVIDNIIPESATGLFDSTSSMDDFEDLLGEDDDDFLFN
jgi:hypothetical protein